MTANAAKSASAKRVILIAEDDHHLREMLGFLLGKAGFKILTAASGEEAVAKLSLRPDVLLLDLIMPGCGGLGVLQRLRESREPAPRVLVLTGQENDHPAVLEAAKDSNVRRIFAKPANAEFLVNAIRGLLGMDPL